MKPFRAALIGCGLIGSRFHGNAEQIGVYTHAGAYNACARTRLVALCDANAQTLAEAGEQWLVQERFTSVERLLAEVQPEIVSICTPDASHASILLQVLANPGVRAVFAEKPLALNVAEAGEVLRVAGERPVLVNYSRRFTRNHRLLKTLISSGELGPVQQVQGFYTKGLFHNGTHWIDLARWLVGEVVGVRAYDALRECGPDPSLDVRLTFAGGATGTLTAVPQESYSLFEMDILCVRGRVRLMDGGWNLQVFRTQLSARYPGYQVLGDGVEIEGDMRDSTLQAVENLVDHLENNHVPLLCPGVDALRTLVVAEAARRACASGELEPVSAD